MEKKYILTHDLGTASLKSVLFDLNLNPIYSATEAYPLYFPEEGWAEQDAVDWWKAVVKTTQEVIRGSNIKPDKLAGIVFDCQGNCTVPINKDGAPLMPAISWLDTRAAEIVEIYSKGFPKIAGYGMMKILMFLKIAGGGPTHQGGDPISHINWIRLKKPEIYDNTYKFLSCKGYVIHKCTGNPVISRDLAHTSWLADTNPGMYVWSDKILNTYELDKTKLPDINKSTESAGNLTEEAAKELGLKEGTPVIIGAVDLTSAAIGSGALLDNEYHISIGTADWVAAHVSERLKDISHYVGTITSAMENYLCICKQETAGKCLDWIKDQMFQDVINKNKGKPAEVYKALDSIVENTEPGSKNLIFTPWMHGERSIINAPEVRGGFYNVGLEHERSHMLRSVLEGVGFNLKWGLQFLKKWTGYPESINAVGGGAKSDVWCQILADIMGCNINQMVDPELGSVKGAVIIAMVGLGVLNSFSDAIPLIKVKKTYTPNPNNRQIYDKLFSQYIKIYKRNKDLFESLNIE
jgi:xylulokinase